MSVAFRRESDEEHLEPRFELPIPAGPNLVTARGLELIGERRAGLEARLEDCGDPAGIAAIQRDLRYWTIRQITAELAPLPLGEKVEFGTEVRILLNGKPRKLRSPPLLSSTVRPLSCAVLLTTAQNYASYPSTCPF
jgi:hypothetical protein